MMEKSEIASSGGLAVALLRSSGELLAITSQWARLWEQSPSSIIFQHPSWILSWWEVFGADKDLFCLVIRDDSNLQKLRAVIPLCILRDNQNARKLMFIGAGLSDTMDVLVSWEFRGCVAPALFEILSLYSGRWDQFDFQPLPTESPLCVNHSKFMRGELAVEEHHLVLELPGSVAEFENQFSAHFRERLRDAWRKGERMGGIRFEEVEPEQVPVAIEELIRFRRARWQTQGPSQGSAPAATDHAKAEAFFHKVALALLQNGFLRLYRLRIGGKIAAVLMAFIHRKKASLYLMGFDPTFSKASPGTLVLWHGILALIEEGSIECDFLRGQERFKNRWGGDYRPYYSLRGKFPP